MGEGTRTNRAQWYGSAGPPFKCVFGTISGRKPWMINMRDYRGDNYLGRNIGNTDVKGCGNTPASDNYFVSSFVA